MKWVWWSVAGIVGYALWFNGIASAIFLRGAGLWDLYPYSKPLAWFTYFLYGADDKSVRTWLWLSGLPTAALPIVLGGSFISYRRRMQGWTMVMRGSPAAPWARNAPTPSHGDAPFASPDEAAEELRR